MNTSHSSNESNSSHDGNDENACPNRRQSITATNQKAMRTAFEEIEEMASRINAVDSIVETAKHLFQKIYLSNTIGARSLEIITTACLYTACRIEGVPRTFKELCAVSCIKVKQIGRCYKFIQKVLKIYVETIKTADFIPRFCAKLELSMPAERAAAVIARKASKLSFIYGKCPVSLSAVAIYMAALGSNEELDLLQINAVTGVSRETIRKIYKKLHPHAEELFPSNYKFKLPDLNASKRRKNKTNKKR